MHQPFVTAVCITGLEPERVKRFLPMTIQCFENQTYPADRRELLIVADGCFDLLPPSQGNIRVVAVGSKRNLGALRNLGLDHAHGDYLIQWDEDWHHPERINTQIGAVRQQPGSALILGSQVTYCFHRDIAFVRRVLFTREDGLIMNLGIHGSITHPNTTGRYPEIATTEDTEFLKVFPVVRMLDTFPSLYIRFCHDGGVSGHEHCMLEAANWPNGTYALNQDDRPNLMAALKSCGKQMPEYSPGEPPPFDVPVLVEQS